MMDNNEEDQDVFQSFEKIKMALEAEHTPTLESLMTLLYNELSPLTISYITNLDKRYKKIYGKKGDRQYFTKFATRIYFPKENHCFICSRSLAKTIPVIKNIIAGEYQEKTLELKYHDYNSGIEYHGGKLVICSSEIASILLPAPIGVIPKTLLDFLPEY